MFVRWKRRPRTKRKQLTGEWVKWAVLVQSVNTESGPRQKYIGYLGSIFEGHEQELGHQIGFWEPTERHLDRLGLSREDRARIVASLQSVVPKPDKKTMDAVRANYAANAERLSTKGKSAPQ
jgi:hypothetical protein